MKPIHSLFQFVFFVALFGCDQSLPTIEGFDRANWINDQSGCRGSRQAELETLKKSKDRLLCLNQNQMSEILGAPDEHELYERKQKFFYYYVSPGPQCDQPQLNPIRLQIRFSAMGIANEVFFENL